MLPDETLAQAGRLLERLQARGLTLATAESCTGGLIAAALTAVPGSSATVLAGFVTYSNGAKTAMLGVPEAEALTGVPAKLIRAQVRNGLLKARMAGSTTMRIRRADLDAWLDALPAWHA